MAEGQKKEGKGKIYRVSDIKENAIKQRNEIYVKGSDCGFKTGDEFMSYRLGYSTGIYSYSAQGKTQFYIQQAVHLSKTHGFKHAVWLTENGRKEELITDIAMTVMGKSLFTEGVVVTDDELIAAFDWMEDHFWIIDHEDDILTIRDIFTTVKDYELAQEPIVINEETKETIPFKFQSVAIDNASNLAKGDEAKRMAIHEYMNYLMTAINRTSLKMNWHTFILFHVNVTDQITCPVSSIKYMPCPNHYMISGGQQINYLGYQLACVYRPISRKEQLGVIDPETGEPFEINETHIVITKTKPKAVGSQGKFKIYFDVSCQRYYEWVDDQKFYVGQYFNQNGGGNAQMGPTYKPKVKVLDQKSLFVSALPQETPLNNAIKPNEAF